MDIGCEFVAKVACRLDLSQTSKSEVQHKPIYYFCVVIAIKVYFMKHTRTLIFLSLFAIVAFVFYKYRQPRFVAGEKASDFEVGLLTCERA